MDARKTFKQLPSSRNWSCIKSKILSVQQYNINIQHIYECFLLDPQVRYSVIGRGHAAKYFVIDPDSGVLRVRDDLRKVPESELQVDVRAFDHGEPQLSSVVSVPVHVRHVAAPPAERALGFAEDSYNVEVPEDAAAATLIKTLSVLNAKSPGAEQVRCEVHAGDAAGLFAANLTEERNCALWLRRAELDFEAAESHQLEIRLEGPRGALGGARNSTMVKIQVVDVNDNRPELLVPRARLTRGRLFAEVAHAAQFGATVLEVKAHDRDNGRFGKLEFSLQFDEERSRASDFFAIDPSSGIVRTTATFDAVVPQELPFRWVIGLLGYWTTQTTAACT